MSKLEKSVDNTKKQTTKEGQETVNSNTPPPMPEIRTVPKWDSTAEIVITGLEWELIYNTLLNTQGALQASQAVMSRNIVNGQIKLDFEKLNSKTLQYEEMPEDEKAPLIEDSMKQLSAIMSAYDKK